MTATWHSLSHGTNGLVLAYGLTLAAMAVTVIARRGGMATVLLTPIVALPAALVGAIVASLVTAALPAGAVQGASSVTVLLLAGVAGGLLLMRQRAPAEAHHRGTVIGGPSALASVALGAVTLAGVEIPLLDESKHFKLIGTTGSGKSTAIREILTGALARGDRAIIADPDLCVGL